MSLEDKIDYMNHIAKCLKEELEEAKKFWDSASRKLEQARELHEMEARR